MLKTSHMEGGQKVQAGPSGLTWHLSRGIDATDVNTGEGVGAQTETDEQPHDGRTPQTKDNTFQLP